MKKVEVTQTAFHGGARVYPGDILTVADAFQAKWASDVAPMKASEPVAETAAEAPVEAAVEEPKRRSPKKPEAPSLPDFGGDLA